METKGNLLAFLFLRHLRTFATKPRISVEMEEQLTSRIKSDEIKPRKHPGVMKIKTVEIPSTAIDAMKVIVKDKPIKGLLNEVKILVQYLQARHLPAEEDSLKKKATNFQLKLETMFNVDRTNLSEEDETKVDAWLQKEVKKQLKHSVYNWQPVTYDEKNAQLYMLGRFVPEYAVLCRIFSEIKKREPEFQPKTLFDFGSGLGTVTWAARSVWGNTINEYFNVDSSSEMNDLASLLLREGNEDKSIPFKGVFYRQFLPVSQNLKYDLIVSAYSLLELPSSKSRLETLVNLWNKTSTYLVLVEQGTSAGFQIINEARDFLLEISQKKQIHVSVPVAHVFSPCPHDFTCPRFKTDTTPCNFEVSYIPLSFLYKSDARKERFSYVVLKKGVRSEDDPQWPRIVRHLLVRRKHTICRMCTSAGKLEEIIFTASKHGKIPYHCGRSSNWGDLLPMTLVHSDKEE